MADGFKEVIKHFQPNWAIILFLFKLLNLNYLNYFCDVNIFLFFIINESGSDVKYLFLKKSNFCSTMSSALSRVISHELCPLSTYFLPKFCTRKCIFSEVKLRCQVSCITWAGIYWSLIILRKKTQDRLVNHCRYVAYSESVWISISS